MSRFLTAAAFALLPTAAGADEPNGTDLPRYKFEVGREITFRSASTFKYGEGKTAGEHGTKDDWTVWVVRPNPDGSVHLVIRYENSFYQVIGKQKASES